MGFFDADTDYGRHGGRISLKNYQHTYGDYV